MPLEPGTRIGPYIVHSLIGRGGMGEVYRARDPRLDREVALKTLAEAVATDPERLARFAREGQTLAALNHPHIAQIHGLEQDHGITALVMELVDGEDLAQRIARGPLTWADAQPIATQIASALEAAHDRGIVHRDLKPANIRLTPEGSVRVLDFGLAATTPAGGAHTRSLDAATAMTSPALTMAGMILGTAAYMSPEQAGGRPADQRSDVWAFGCVLFEMLTGRAPFAGETATETLADVLKGEPDWAQLPAGLPPRISNTIRRCLVKDPRERLHAIGDVRLALDGAFETAPAAAAVVPVERRWLTLLPWTLAAAAVAAAVVAHTGVAPVQAPPIQFGLPSSDSFRIATNLTIPFAIDPTGTRIVFVAHAEAEEERRLWVRAVNDARPRALAGTERGTQPAFSPDGRWLAFIADSRIRKVPAEGGPVTTVLELAHVSAALSWLSNDEILFETLSGSRSIHVVGANGGAARELFPLDERGDEIGQRRPFPIRDSRRVVFTSRHRSGAEQLVLGSVDDGRRTLLNLDGVQALGVVEGRLVYARADGVLMAAPFDVTRGTTGAPVQLLEQVGTSTYGVAAALSESGTLVASAGVAESHLTIVDRSGGRRRLGTESRAFAQPRVSPDGTTVAVGVRAGEGYDIWLFDPSSGASRRLSRTGAVSGFDWTPDGHRLMYTVRRPGAVAGELWVVAADGGEDPTRVDDAGLDVLGAEMAADGTRIVWRHDSQRQHELILLRPSSPPVRLEGPPASPRAPRISPDGKLLIFHDLRALARTMYVREIDGDARLALPAGGGTDPVWAADSRRIFYRAGDDLMEADLDLSPRLRITGERRVMGLPPESQATFYADYDVDAEGRVVLLEPVDVGADVRVTLNWAGEQARSWQAR